MLANLVSTIPPITRIQLILIIGISLLVQSEIFTYTFWSSSYTVKQIWRIVTSWMFVHNLDFFFVFRLLMFGQFSSSIEKSGFKRGSVDHLYFTFLLFLGMMFFATLFSISYLTNIYFYAICYFYGRVHSNHLVIINLLPVRAPFILWVILMFQWVIGDPDMKSTILSVFLGHTLYFLLNVYPKLKFVEKKDLFDTPRIMIDYLTPYFRRQFPEDIM